MVRGDLSVRTGHRISRIVEDCILAKVDRVTKVLVHIEPEEEFFDLNNDEM